MELDREDRSCRACISVEELMKRAKQLAKNRKGNQGNETTTEEQDPSTSSHDFKNCPVDKDELGRSTWNLLHTMSVYYPQKPTEVEKKTASTFMESLAKLYPCDFCAKDLRKDLKGEPPKLENREEFAMWMCRLHNKVNRKMGKPDFDCSKVFERWKDGWKDGSCDY
ncbi:hypothetical protein KIN20_002368 [Parelaphostrongylus tenuis]|uniref:Sulfhydryl oxidase n=1 Tax=Parelaphostrongylus tenuis TaxID=148309 RepID=A0AAD5ME37_PARTN|nr:hypothetical protein KIN20_002368 [Parelaphostrongylus tenuis]